MITWASFVTDTVGGSKAPLLSILSHSSKFEDMLGHDSAFMAVTVCYNVMLTITDLDHCFLAKILVLNRVCCKCDFFIWNWSSGISILSALWLLMAWCIRTKSTVATRLISHPCISSCFWIEEICKQKLGLWNKSNGVCIRNAMNNLLFSVIEICFVPGTIFVILYTNIL